MATPNDIYNEITRIDTAKQGIAEAIEEKGVQVPAGTPIQDFPGKVRQIQTGSPDAVLYTPQDLTPEQQEQARENIGAYTKPETGIPAADLAEPVQQELAKAGTAYQKPGTGIPKTDLANGVQTSLEKADTALQPAALTPITELIPEQATPQNQLADKNFVNSSVATNTANYISDNGQPFQSVADLEAYTGPLTNNDYAFVVGTDSAGNTTYTRYKYNATTQTWAAEYVLNNSSFTAEQWAAISSGITALLVQKLSDLPTEIVTYVAQTLTEAQKQQARTNIGATAPEIFWATYGTTTRQEIIDAVSAGKIVALRYETKTFVAFNVNTTPGNTGNFVFSCQYSGNLQSVILNSNGTWGALSGYTAENYGNKVSDIPGNRESTTKYPNTKGVFDLVGKWGVVSQTITWTGSNSTGYTYSISNPIYGFIPNAHIVMFNRAGAIFNETTGYFELNELTDIPYNEMLDIYVNSIGALPYEINRNSQFNNYPYRTTVKIKFQSGYSTSINHMFAYSSYIHIAYMNGCNNLSSTSSAFRYCYRLKKIIGTLGATSWSADNFQNCASLEYLRIEKLRSNLVLSESGFLGLDSIQFIVQSATNTTAITITLHANAYARCQADTTQYTYDGNTYTGVIAYAAAKNITIQSA